MEEYFVPRTNRIEQEVMDMPEGFLDAAALLPDRLRDAALALPETDRGRAEEIRLRAGREPAVLLPEGERVICRGLKAGTRDMSAVLERATCSSVHAAEHELRRGFVSARGGVRVGVCGTLADGERGGMRMPSSVCIRVPRQIKGAGAVAIAELTCPSVSVLALSPPGGGKTTFLRELVRTVSDCGTRVSLCDERAEVAAVWEGQPQFDVGRCTDVLTGAPKADAAMLLLRAMNPQVIALDEITARQDIEAIEAAANCGVRVYATAHAAGLDELCRRPIYRQLMELHAFDAAVVISGTGECRRYEVEYL